MTDNKTIDFKEALIRQFVESRRPSEDIRDQLDVGYTFTNNVLEIFTIRPMWNNPQEKIHEPVVKARYIKSSKTWKLYWMRASGKWEAYEPESEVKETDKMLKIIDEDAYHCFWG